ncbi:MAG TPA: type II secretion system protein GspM [Gemmatimonadaceae bacterium]|nr:type II secretion system protein GspM [Gemmatimonadaceae bacterium]
MPGTAPRDRRTLVIGALVIGALVLGTRGAPALVRVHSDMVRSARELEAEARRAQEAVAAAPVVAESLRARNVRYRALAPALLDGDTPAGAAATLAGLLSEAASAAQVRVGTVQLRVDTAARGAFARVGVRADVIGDVEGITGMLAALERGPEVLVIRELAITQPDPGAGDDQPEALRMELMVEGLAVRRRGR